MEKLEARIDEKLEQMRNKFPEDIQVEIQQGLARVSTELGSLIRQLIPQAERASSDQKISEVLTLESPMKPPNSVAGSSGPAIFQVQANQAFTSPVSGIVNLILDLLKINSKRSKL